MKQAVRRAADERMNGFLGALTSGLPGAEAPGQNHAGYLVMAVQSGPDATRARRLGFDGPAALPLESVVRAAREALKLQDVWAAPAGAANRVAILAGLEDGRGLDEAAFARFASVLTAPEFVTLVYQDVRSPGEIPKALDSALHRIREALIPGHAQILRPDQPLSFAAPSGLTAQQEGVLAAALKWARRRRFKTCFAGFSWRASALGQPAVRGGAARSGGRAARAATLRRPLRRSRFVGGRGGGGGMRGRDGGEIALRFSERAAALLCSYGPDGDPSRSTEAVIGHIHQYIERQYDQPVELQSLAAEYGISDSYLSTLYKKKYGLSPLRHLITLRIERAKALILSGVDLPFRTIGAWWALTIRIIFPGCSDGNRLFPIGLQRSSTLARAVQ